MAVQAMPLEEVRRKVEIFLREKRLNYEVRAGGDFYVRYGSTFAVVAPREWQERTLVKLLAPVALNITKITPELTRFLAEKNNQLVFGKFSLDTRNSAVVYQHALLGDFLDAEELFIGVAAIVGTADQYDEEVSNMAGGERVADLERSGQTLSISIG
jgi:hypothetical protein